MAQTTSSLQRWEPIVLGILRIVVGLLILQHGTQKLFHFPPPDKPMGSLGELPPLVLAAGILELVGGLLLILGLFTRPAAFILSGFMAVAYFMAHASGSLYPITNHGELAVALCFVFLYLAFAGGGRWSVDAARHKA
ncbi:MAG: DoxX family protein [Spartobacteria bacterium]